MSNNLSSSLSHPSNGIKNNLQSYQADQQVKYLHLEAEIDILLQQIRQQLNKQVPNIDK